MTHYIKRLLFITLLVATGLLWYESAQIDKKSKYNDNLAQVNKGNAFMIFGNTAPFPLTEYGYISTNNAYSGVVFVGQPDEWHEPTLILVNTPAWRSDISDFSEIRFFARADSPQRIHFTIGNTSEFSNSFEIDLTTEYRLVTIPIKSLNNNADVLSSIESLYFGLAPEGQKYNIYIDEIVAVR